MGKPIPGATTSQIVLRPHRLLVLLPDGTLWEWKDIGPDAPTVGPRIVDGASRWIALAATWGTYMAIKADGTLWAWGTWPLEGGKSRVYEQVPIQVGTDSDWKSMACGHRHALALKTDGSLWAWGANKYGQLGDGTKTNRASPVRVGSDTNWAGVAAESDYSVAVKNDGSLWHWGVQELSNPLGYRVSHSPARIGAGTNWASVFCGEALAMAIQRDGGLWAWGRIPVAAARTWVPVKEPMRVGGESDWKTAAPSFGGTAGIRADGSLGMWETSYTWLTWHFGKARAEQSSGLTKLSERSDWIAVASASQTMTILALSADGRLWTWGWPLDEPLARRRLLCYSRLPRLVTNLRDGETR
jgi:alpha-tubulin suppressor-like RCC1 family protein